MSKRVKNISSLRQRIRHTFASDTLPEYYGNPRYSTTTRKNVLPTPTSHLVAVFVALLVIIMTVIVIEKKLPPGLKIIDEKLYPDRFIAERAMKSLINLTEFGPRISGSYENEVLAVNCLVNEIKEAISKSKDIHIIELDIQKSSGAFPLTFLDGMTNVYRDVQSVVVKIGSKINSPYSLLINCHFDSVTDSPGASDDGAGCAVMLEMFRVLTQSDKLLRHNIIFLFNGAEENLMQASHGFITQHKWSKEVKVFINLEACGAGGRELLFQAGPNHPWILETYSESVPYPYASSLAQEIFQSGIIPGDTDYRIFRDFGNASGLDFAWSTNGYVYHTKFDNVNQIPLGSLQRTGDNILALARGLANGHQISDIEQFRSGNLVFFDFLGAFVIRWLEYVADFVNLATIVFSLCSIYANMILASREISKHTYMNYLFLYSGIIFIAWILALIAVLLIALSLTALGRTMSWFSRPVWLFFLYICPTICVSMATILIASKWKRKDIISPWTIFQLFYDAFQLIWTVILFFAVIFRIRSGFIPLLWVLFPAVGNVIRITLFRHWRDWKWLILHMLVIFLPFTQCFYLALGALYLFVPIMGRSGAGNNSELMIATMISLIFSELLSYILPLITIVKNPERILSFLLGLFLISVGLLILTPLGFPYSGDRHSLSPQRFMIVHTKRTFHDEIGNIRDQDTGYWIVDLDINSPHTVDYIVPEMTRAQPSDEDCATKLYCGMPYLLPVQNFIWKTHWVPGPPPVISIPTDFTIEKRERISDDVIKLSIKITGPDHIGVMISPMPQVNLQKWSLVKSPPLAGPKWKGRDTYFVYYAYAAKPVPLNFTMEFKVPHDYTTEPIMDIAITSHFLHGTYQMSAQFREFLAQFPIWTAITGWTATYTSYVV